MIGRKVFFALKNDGAEIFFSLKNDRAFFRPGKILGTRCVPVNFAHSLILLLGDRKTPDSDPAPAFVSSPPLLLKSS